MQGYIKYADQMETVRFYGITVPTGCFYGFCKKYPFISTGYKSPAMDTTRVFKLIGGKWEKFEENSSFTKDLNREFRRITAEQNAATAESRKRYPETYRNYTRMAEVPKPAYDAKCKFFCKSTTQVLIEEQHRATR